MEPLTTKGGDQLQDTNVQTAAQPGDAQSYGNLQSRPAIGFQAGPLRV